MFSEFSSSLYRSAYDWYVLHEHAKQGPHAHIQEDEGLQGVVDNHDVHNNVAQLEYLKVMKSSCTAENTKNTREIG